MSTPAAEQPANPQRTMQAVVFDDFGGPEVLVAREIPIPEVRPHDLLVRNASIGVNRADLLHRKGAYGRAYFGDADTMGLEIAGTVVAMGPEVQGFALGDRVMGIVGGGAYAELTRIDHRMAMPVPAGMDSVAAGAVAEVFVTARVRHGRGRQAWRRAGLGGRCVHRLPQRRLSGGGGAGYAGPGRGGGDRLHRGSVPAAQRAVVGRRRAPGVGGAAGGGAQGAELPMDVVLYRHLQIFGTVMKSRPPEVKQAMVQRFAQQWLPALAAGVIRPVIDSTFALADAAHAHRRMESGASIGKILLLPQGS